VLQTVFNGKQFFKANKEMNNEGSKGKVMMRITELEER
jgi:hypothetical protein